MRIGYIDPFPSNSNNSWPRLSAKFLQELRDQGIDVDVYDRRKLRSSVFDKTKKLMHLIKQERYLFEREPALLRHIAQGIEQHYAGNTPDIILSLSTLPLAYLEMPCPMVFWTDSLFPGLVDYYPGFTGLSDQSLRDGDMADRLAMSKASLALFTSSWAAGLARANYVPHAAPCQVVAWGADLHQVPERDQVHALIKSRPTDVCRLLFIGYDWQRKGGPEVLEIRSELMQRGVPTELFIIGSTPQILDDDGSTHILGYLSKDLDVENALFQQVLSACHFLVLPASADSTAVAFAEAAAYGVPTLTSNVGGHSSIIKDGINGYTFPHESCIRKITNHVQELFNDRARYIDLAIATRNEYDQRLNWEHATMQVIQKLEEVIRSV